jgi:hypothetical protein
MADKAKAERESASASAPVVEVKRKYRLKGTARAVADKAKAERESASAPKLPVAKAEAPVVAPPMVAKKAEGGGGSRPVKEEEKEEAKPEAKAKPTTKYPLVTKAEYIHNYKLLRAIAGDKKIPKKDQAVAEELRTHFFKESSYDSQDRQAFLNGLAYIYNKYTKRAYKLPAKLEWLDWFDASKTDQATGSEYIKSNVELNALGKYFNIYNDESGSDRPFGWTTGGSSLVGHGYFFGFAEIKEEEKTISTAWDSISDSEILSESKYGNGWGYGHTGYGLLKPIIIDDTLYYFNKEGHAWRVLRNRQGWGPYVYAGIYDPVHNKIIPTTLEYIIAHPKLQSDDEKEILRYMKEDGLSFERASKRQYEWHERHDKAGIASFTYRGIDFFTGKEYKHGRNADD